jgi:hypothetical protein
MSSKSSSVIAELLRRQSLSKTAGNAFSLGNDTERHT